MGFQLIASRLLAPVFGTTLFVGAFIISTFLAAFSGALIGGSISRLDARRVRNAIVVIGIIGSGSLGFTAEIGRETIAYFDSMTTWMWISLGKFVLILVFFSRLGDVVRLANYDRGADCERSAGRPVVWNSLRGYYSRQYCRRDDYRIRNNPALTDL
jgi:uncharacterized membrane protein